MAEKFKYGPLVYNCYGDEDDSGNYWWAGNPPVAYEEDSGPYRIPIDADGNQCLPGECILHPNCRVEEWNETILTYTIKKDVIGAFVAMIPSLVWCKSWFEDNFLVIDDYTVCRYILRWVWWNNKNKDEYRQFFKDKTLEEVIREIWPDVIKS